MHALRLLVAFAGTLLPAAFAQDGTLSTSSSKRAIRPNPSNGHWVDTWVSMPQLTEPANLPPAPFVSHPMLSSDLILTDNPRIKAVLYS